MNLWPLFTHPLILCKINHFAMFDTTDVFAMQSVNILYIRVNIKHATVHN